MGKSEGAKEGETDGCGDVVGDEDGDADGSNVSVGCNVGESEGEIVGPELGAGDFVGTMEIVGCGLEVRVCVGSKDIVGDVVGDPSWMGLFVGALVGVLVGESVSIALVVSSICSAITSATFSSVAVTPAGSVTSMVGNSSRGGDVWLLFWLVRGSVRSVPFKNRIGLVLFSFSDPAVASELIESESVSF